MGSASELEYQLMLARDLKMLNLDAFSRHCNDLEEIKRMLTTYIRKIRAAF
jgi:four helix bundle protein